MQPSSKRGNAAPKADFSTNPEFNLTNLDVSIYDRPAGYFTDDEFKLLDVCDAWLSGRGDFKCDMAELFTAALKILPPYSVVRPLGQTEYSGGTSWRDGGKLIKPQLTQHMLIARDALRWLSNDKPENLEANGSVWRKWVQLGDPDLFELYGGEAGLKAAWARPPIIDGAFVQLIEKATAHAAYEADERAFRKVEPEIKAAHDEAKPYVSTCAADVEMKRIDWAWPGRIPRGKITLIGGYPKLGKTQITCALAAPITTYGGKFPDGSAAPYGSAAFITGEDDLADTIKPRLVAAGADPSKVHVFQLARVKCKDGKLRMHPFDVARHLKQLTAFIQDIGDLVMLVIDPILAYMGAADSHNTAEVRAALLGLQTLVAERNIACVLITHLNKNEKAQSAMNRLAASGAFAAVARSLWLVAPDPSDPTEERRLFVPIGGNNGKHKDGFAYRIEEVDLSDGIVRSKVVFESNTVRFNADELLRPRRDPAQNDAGVFLASALINGARPVRELIKRPRARVQAGHLRRSKTRTPGRCERAANGF